MGVRPIPTIAPPPSSPSGIHPAGGGVDLNNKSVNSPSRPPRPPRGGNGWPVPKKGGHGRELRFTHGPRDGRNDHYGDGTPAPFLRGEGDSIPRFIDKGFVDKQQSRIQQTPRSNPPPDPGVLKKRQAGAPPPPVLSYSPSSATVEEGGGTKGPGRAPGVRGRSGQGQRVSPTHRGGGRRSPRVSTAPPVGCAVAGGGRAEGGLVVEG